MLAGIKAVALPLTIAEVKVCRAFKFACEVKYFAIALQHFVLICPEFSERPYMGRFIENGCSPLVSVQCSLPDFLTEVQHKWSREEEGGNGKGAIAALCASGKPGGCNPLFIVILKEIEHTALQRPQLLPIGSNVGGRSGSGHNATPGALPAGLVIEIVEMSLIQICSIIGEIVAFTDEYRTRIILACARNHL